MTRPPVGLSGLSQVWMTGWPGVSTACCGFFGERLAADGDLAAVDAGLRSMQALGEEARAAGVLVVLGGVLAAGREVADEAACAR